MSDPISLASGLLALTVFAFQSSKLLYQAVEGFQKCPRSIRDLKEGLEALDGVLQSLHDTASNSDIGLTGLKLPLLRCGNACRDLEKLIIKCSTHSSGSKTSVRDWAKLQYMGKDIVGFQMMLADYKSTISIALAGANVRTAVITVDLFNEYKAMIAKTTSNLEEHLEDINDKLQSLSVQGARMSDEDVDERDRIQQERDTTEQCLRICAQVTEHMDQVQPNAFGDVPTADDAIQVAVAPPDYIPARRVTSDAFKTCKKTFANTTSELQGHLQEMDGRLQNFSRGVGTKSEHPAEREQIQKEKESIKQCIAICAQASEQADQVRTNVFENVSAAEEADQVVVATFGDLVSARGVAAGVRSRQWLGQMFDDSLQQLSRDRGRVAIEKAVGPRNGLVEKFEDKYGSGYRFHEAWSSRRS